MSMDFLLDSKASEPSAASVLASNAGNADNRSSSPFSLIPSTRSPDPLKQVSLNPQRLGTEVVVRALCTLNP